MSNDLHFKFTADDKNASSAFNRLNNRLKQLDHTSKRTNAALAGIDAKMEHLVDVMTKANEQTRKTTTSLQRLEKRFEGVGRAAFEGVMVLGMLEGAFISLQHIFWTWQDAILRSADDLERMNLMMRGLATTSDAATEAMRDVNYVIDMTKSAPFKMEALKESFVKLKVAGIDPTDGSMRNLVDAVSAFGGSDEELKRASVAIQQMAGKSVVSMEELRQQLGESVPAAMKMMARGMGVSVGELSKAIEQGTVEAKTAIDIMLGEFELAFAGSAEKMMNTYSGQMSKLAANFKKIGDEIGKGTGEGANTSYYDAVTEAIRALNAQLETKAFKEWSNEFGKWLAEVVNGLVELSKTLWENREAIIAVSKAIGILLAANVTAGITKLLAAPIVKLLSLFSKLRTKVLAITTPMGGFAKAIAAAGRIIVRFIPHLMAATTALWAFWEAGKAAFKLWNEHTFADRTVEMADGIIADPKTATKDSIAEMQERLAQARELLKTAEREEVGKLKEAIAKLQVAINKASEYVYEADAISLIEQANRRVAEAMEDSRNLLNKEMDYLAESYSRIMDKDMPLAEKMEALGQVRAQQRFLAEGILKQEISILEREQSNIRKVMAAIKERAGGTLGGESLQKYKAYEKILESHTDRVAELREKLLDVEKRYSGEIKTIRADAGGELLDKGTKQMGTYLKTLEVQLARMEGRENGVGAFFSAAEQKVEQFTESLGKLAKEESFIKLKDQILETAAAMDDLAQRKKFVEEANKLRKQADAWLRSDMNYQGPTKLDEFNTEFENIRRNYEQILNLATQPNTLIKPEDVEHAEKMLNFMKDQKQVMKDQIILAESVTPMLDKLVRKFEKNGDYKSKNSRQARLDAFNKQAQDELNAFVENARRKGMSHAAFEKKRIEITAAAEREREKIMEGAFADLAVKYADFGEQLENTMAGALEGIADATADFMMEGEADWKRFASNVIREILRISMMKVVISPIAEGISNGLTGFFGSGSSTMSAPDLSRMAPPSLNAPVLPNSPSLNSITNASPVGRSMPPAPAVGQANVEFNVINQSGEQVTAREQGRRFDGKKMILDVVLEAANKPGHFRDGMKGALA